MFRLKKIERLKGHNQAQAQVIRQGNEIILRSYSTNVLFYNVIEKTVYCTGRYSMTTIKHIGWFMTQFTDFGYHEIKDCFMKDASLYVGFINRGVK
jgi:hypothetical protein